MSEARDVLRANREGCSCEKYRNPCMYHRGWDDAIDNAEQHPVELLALITEPKRCPMCGPGLVTLDCDCCHGTGKLRVDVLDPAVKAGLVEPVKWHHTARLVFDGEGTDEVFRRAK